MFLDDLPFYLSSPLCYLIGPGDRLLNLFFLALHSIVPYLLGGLWAGGQPSLPPHPHRWTSALSKSSCFQWIGARVGMQTQRPPAGAPRPSPPDSQPVLLMFSCSSRLLGHRLSSPGFFSPLFPPPLTTPPHPGVGDRGKGYLEFSSKNCPGLIHLLSSVNTLGLVEPP